MKSFMRRLDRTRGKAIYFVASVALLGAVLVGSSILAWQSSREQELIVQANFETIQVLRATSGIKLAALNALRGKRGFLLTGDRSYLEPYLEGRKALALRLNDLEALQPDNLAAVYTLRNAASDYLAMLEQVITLTENGKREQAIDLVKQNGSKNDLASIDKLADAIIEKERLSIKMINDHAARVNKTLLHLVYLMSATGMCLLILAALSAFALHRSFERARDYRMQLQKCADTDELTGLANRCHLLAVLERSIVTARETQSPLSFALLDIDNFKRVNDTYGHTTGDRALRHVAQAASSVIRGNDLVGRLGGEEFGIILPFATVDNAYTICERLRNRLLHEGLPIGDDQTLWTTISAGVTSLQDDDDAASLIERADKALYAAKSDGRDRVRLAP